MSKPLEVVPAGSFCWNKQCSGYGIVAPGNLRRLRAACRWEDAVYNWTRPCSSLAREGPDGKKQKRTPAMAAGLTDNCWTMWHLLSMVVPPRRRQP
jgi:hypothetical protein